jgi:uncharacterized membrane protein
MYLILGLVIFFGTHLFSAYRSREPGKDLRLKMGQGPYMGLYSLLSLAGFALIIWGYGAARPAPILYTPPAFLAHINLLLMAFAMIFLAAAYLPTGHIKKAVKHPMLLAVKIWAFGHLLANGELNSLLLFGSFLLWAVLDFRSARQRDRAAGTVYPAGSAGRTVLVVVLGVAVWALFAFWLHAVLFGVRPFGAMEKNIVEGVY